MKTKALLLALTLLTLTGALRAADGARLVHYSEKDVIPINAKVRFSTLIVLPANEEILDYTTGDKDYWIINGVHNLPLLSASSGRRHQDRPKSGDGKRAHLFVSADRDQQSAGRTAGFEGFCGAESGLKPCED